jgi:hypothetical protein
MMRGNNEIKSRVVLASTTLIVTLLIAALVSMTHTTAQAAISSPDVMTTKKINKKNIVVSIVAKVAEVDDTGNLLKGAVRVGDTILGKYVYNPLTPDSNIFDTTVGDYRYNDKPYGITLSAHKLVFQTDPNNVEFLVELVNREGDNYLLRSYNNLPISKEVLVNHIAWQLDDPSGKALPSDSLEKAPAPPVLGDWQHPPLSPGLTIEGSDSHESNTYLIRADVILAKVK